jgi:hypothetical protein
MNTKIWTFLAMMAAAAAGFGACSTKVADGDSESHFLHDGGTGGHGGDASTGPQHASGAGDRGDATTVPVREAGMRDGQHLPLPDAPSGPRCGLEVAANRCAPNEVCVHQDWNGSFTCKPNPCGSMPVTCDCAASACGVVGLCGSVVGGIVGCFCPNC